MAEIVFQRSGFNLIELGISIRTLSPFYHCEIRFGESEHFSSSFRDGGVRFKNIDCDASYVRYGIIASTEMILTMRHWCELRAAEKAEYDMFSLMACGWTLDNFEKWFCSEICARALQKGAVLDRDDKKLRKPSPGSLERYVSRRSKLFEFCPTGRTFFTDKEGDARWFGS